VIAEPNPHDFSARLAARLGPRHRVAAAVGVSGSGTVLASTGCAVDDDFEIGSISKGLTGLLYVDALERGEVTRQTTLGDVLPLGSSAASQVRLDAISRHRSGLPRLPRSTLTVRKTYAFLQHGTNPYGETFNQLLDQARHTKVGKPRPLYSNFGFELLGHALAHAAGTTYAELVATRIAQPLGLTGLYVPASSRELRPNSLTGSTRRGTPRPPWTGAALGPAGGVRATIRDLGRFADALLTGTAPGIRALDPLEPFGKGAKIGAAWITVDHQGQPVTWHNGGTGGFRSWLGLDRRAGSAVAILTASSVPVDRHGFELLAQIS
jgi:CubicO group peptidase (beta-lactamase class C family)